MAAREKLIALFCEANNLVTDACLEATDILTYAQQKAMYADHLISHGVTVRERGRWIPHYETFDADMAVGILGGNYQTGWQCSVCGRYEPSKEPYCNCGADMRGEEDGN